MPREPECGKDFCQRCGDCLYCYGSDPCLHGDEHIWPEDLKEDGETEVKES